MLGRLRQRLTVGRAVGKLSVVRRHAVADAAGEEAVGTAAVDVGLEVAGSIVVAVDHSLVVGRSLHLLDIVLHLSLSIELYLVGAADLDRKT